MNAPSAPAEKSGEDAGARLWPWVLPGFLVCLVAISRQSLWIDEAFMAAKASQPTLADWRQAMLEGGGSDLQMPLYMIYVWGFAKIFGLSEWALRAANIPWFVVGVAAFIRVAPQPQRLAVALVTLAAPFAWYYLNEARPYAMQLGMSLLIFAALYHLSRSVLTPWQETGWFAAFCFGLFALCGSSLLGVIWAGAALLCAPFLFSFKRLWALSGRHKFAGLFTCLLLAVLGGYYIWTLKLGARALPAGTADAENPALVTMRAAANFRTGLAGRTDPRNLAFLVYELLGLGGLGPGRMEIREGGLSVFRPYLIPLLIYALVLGDFLRLAVLRLGQSSTGARWFGVALMLILPMALLLGAGYFLHFRVLGRHFTPIVPVLLFLLSVGLAMRWSRRGWISRLVVLIFFIMSVDSCLSFRFAARHEKDDYRDAAAAANAALRRGERVWWSADTHGAVYYHLPLNAGTNEVNGAFLALNMTPDMLSHLPEPDLIVVSKPDLYDSRGTLAQYIQRGSYVKSATPQAFTIWGRKDQMRDQRKD